MRRFTPAFVVALMFAAALALAGGNPAAAQTGEVIRSFDVTYVLAEDGAIAVTEEIVMDFSTATEERHGIFRYLPEEVRFDDDSNRLFTIENISVSDGVAPRRVDLSTSGTNLVMRIGEPDVLVTGEQRYVITYTLFGALNAFDDHDELFWNVNGNDWLVPIEHVSVTVELPGPGNPQVECFQGPLGSRDPCDSSADASSATFETTVTQPPGSGLTIVVGFDKGLVSVPLPTLVAANESVSEQIADFLGASLVTITIAALTLVALLALLVRQWWLVGRDRWFGEQYYFRDAPDPETRPLFSNETIVVEYEPPEVAGQERRMRPAEAGLLLDERADTLDVTATIVDLAVRGYLRIEELAKEGFFGSKDYELTSLMEADDELLPYERRLLDALFESGSTVRLDDLKTKFHEDLKKVKKDLYDQGVKKNNFFPGNPETVRNFFGLAGIVLGTAGGLAVWLLGGAAGLGVLGIPFAIGGVALVLSSSAMPRRTARGRQQFRRVLGFRTFMEAGDQARERFAEEANIFSEYLPYAIVFGSAEKWAKRFEDLGIDMSAGSWYIGPHAFAPVAFAAGMSTFSTSVGGVMAATPGGSGGSGFGGGGFSGGGGGGGGGGGW